MRLMLLGAIGSGKTTFRQRLSNVDAAYAKTQTVYLADGVLDTPGEYLEHGRFNRALLLTSYDADLVLMFQSATASETKIPRASPPSSPSRCWGSSARSTSRARRRSSAPGTSWLWPARARWPRSVRSPARASPACCRAWTAATRAPPA
ncbi:MAG: hypothetical protein IPO80_12550 [Propionibacteriaceae bacterium]|nr:hypothetical protein [Propionibacteriaceae bacterium]